MLVHPQSKRSTCRRGDIRGARRGAAFLLAISLAAQMAGARLCAAQPATPAQHEVAWWPWTAAGLLLASSLLADEPLRRVALANQRDAYDDAARAADALGTAHHLLPAMALAYGAARLGRRDDLARATLRVAIAYTAADVAESVLKPAVGRERPYASGDHDAFRPFSGNGDFHSFPSAHVVHAMSIAAALSEETGHEWVAALAYGAVTFVGAQRVYRDQHWASDVVASGALGYAISKTVVRRLRARAVRPAHSR